METHLWMALSEQELHHIEVHAEQAARAAQVLSKVRAVHEESSELHDRLEKQAEKIVLLQQVIGDAGRIIRSVEQIFKNPVTTVQTNYEDFLPPELRQLHDRFIRGVF